VHKGHPLLLNHAMQCTPSALLCSRLLQGRLRSTANAAL